MRLLHAVPRYEAIFRLRESVPHSRSSDRVGATQVQTCGASHEAHYGKLRISRSRPILWLLIAVSKRTLFSDMTGLSPLLSLTSNVFLVIISHSHPTPLRGVVENNRKVRKSQISTSDWKYYSIFDKFCQEKKEQFLHLHAKAWSLETEERDKTWCQHDAKT